MKEPSPPASPYQRNSERRQGRLSVATERRKFQRRRGDLSWIALFSNADPDQVNAALADCQVLSLPAGTVLLEPGQTNHHVYILLSGQAGAYLTGDSGGDTAIPMGTGECIGELSAIDGKPVSALVMTLTPARVLKLSREVLWDRLMALHGVASNLMMALTERMRRTNEQALKAQREQLELVHLRKELEVARQLQTSMVPLQRPLFPHNPAIEVCGFMEPASIVGGDLFDAFFIDDQHLFICIGDVSGHGVAAALFMARTIGLLRVLAMNTMAPDQLLHELNNRLCQDNDANIFVTLFCGVYVLDSGRLVYSNGGHCAPLLCSDGRAELLPIPKGPLIGAFAGVRFSAMEITLKAGQTLFCYTDGVTEAQAPDGQEYSEARSQAELERHSAVALPALLDNMRLSVALFTGSGTLEDDCTMLALRRRSVTA